MSNNIIMCDDNSDVRATYAYTWAWGERGHCSEAGKQRREQLAQTLQRHVAFVPLGDSEPVPMVLDERARLAGQIYALTEENKELRSRGAEMYAELGQLRSDNRLLVLREREASRAAEQSATVVDQAQRGLSEFERKNSELLEEVGLLRALVPSSEAMAEELFRNESMRSENLALKEMVKDEDERLKKFLEVTAENAALKAELERLKNPS